MWVRGGQSDRSVDGAGSDSRQSAAQVRSYLRADRRRLLEILERDAGMRPRLLWLHPSYQAVFLHRWSSFFFSRRHVLIARLLWHLNLLLSGADISPNSRIGPGLVLVHPLTVVLVGRAGRNLTVRGHGGFGGGLDEHDIGAGPGLPVLGDDVSLDFSTRVLGPIRIGNGARIGPGCGVTCDVADGTHRKAAAPFVRVRTGAHVEPAPAAP